MPTSLNALLLDPVDLPAAVDGAALRELAASLWDERQIIAAEWTQGLVASVPEILSEDLTTEALTSLNEVFLTLFLQRARDGDLDALYQAYYDMNYRLIDVDLQRAPASRISLHTLYVSARISAQVIGSYLGPAPHDVQLAWGRLSTRLAMIVGLAYSDCREEHIQQSFAQIRTLTSLFQGVLESAPDAMVITDENDDIVLLNSSAERMFGHSRTQLTGRPFGSLVQRPTACSPLQAGLEAAELVGRNESGRQLPVEVRSSPLDTETGRLMVHAVRDITERRRAADALLRAHDELELRVEQRTRELLRANDALHGEIERRQIVEDSLRREKGFADTTLDSLPGIFYLFDTQGRFLRWNRNFEVVSGYAADEISRMHPIDLFASDDKAYIADRIAAVFDTGAATAEADFVSKDGRRTPHFFTGLRVNVGSTLCLIGMGIDISERKRMEEALHASSAELARSNQIKTYFAATISHELRNTFNGIMISNELILADIANPLSGEQCDLLRSVQRRVLEAIQIIHATLELTRSEMQPGADGVHSVDIASVLDELTHEVTVPPSRSDVLLCWSVPAPPAPFYTDPVKLKMILKNLVENALKFTPEGRVDVKVHLDGTLLTCTVSDTGVGIPAAELSHIFEPFHQVHSRAQRRVGGVGLGLYIVRRLVDLLGGTIKVDSVQGRGTSFILRVPSLDQRQPASPTAAADL